MAWHKSCGSPFFTPGRVEGAQHTDCAVCAVAALRPLHQQTRVRDRLAPSCVQIFQSYSTVFGAWSENFLFAVLFHLSSQSDQLVRFTFSDFYQPIQRLHHGWKTVVAVVSGIECRIQALDHVPDGPFVDPGVTFGLSKKCDGALE